MVAIRESKRAKESSDMVDVLDIEPVEEVVSATSGGSSLSTPIYISRTRFGNDKSDYYRTNSSSGLSSQSKTIVAREVFPSDYVIFGPHPIGRKGFRQCPPL